MRKLMFTHLTTLGIRENRSVRYSLLRRVEVLETPYGKVRKKVSEGYGVHREKLEYEDLARIAKEKGISIQKVKKLIKQ